MNFFLFGLIILVHLECALLFNLQPKLPVVLRPIINEVDLEHPINFGVALTTLTNKQNRTILIAGAPAADLGDYNERPGMVFNCDLSDNRNELKSEINCKPIKLQNRNRKPIILNDYMQIGSSLSSGSDKLTVCAAGAINANLKKKDHYPNGQCWFGNHSSLSNNNHHDENEISIDLLNFNPLNDTRQQIYDNTYFFSHGMFGFSSKISKVDSQTIFYGAPGVHEWGGAVLQIKVLKNGQQTINLYRHDYGSYIYFGFSIALAHLFSDRKMYCVVSAPKARQTGAVFVFKPTPFNRGDMIKDVKISKIKTFYGTANGEYFGCAVEAVDLNNDGMDDIIIGSPYYSISSKELMDNGAIYIYLNNENDFDEPFMLFGSGETNAMFGYSIASAGDLDQDGYQDFVVGAPYEDDSGCIYVYNGGRHLSSHYSQKICAKEFGQAYRGFGIKVHGLFDVDTNQYPDVAVGAYLSKNVIVLKSRPVAQINTRFNLNVTSINLKDKSAFCTNSRANGQRVFCFELEICQILSVKHSQGLEDQTLTTTLQLDAYKIANLVNHSIYTQPASSSRAYFELNQNYQPKYKRFYSTNASTTNTLTFRSKLKLNTLSCYAPFLIMLRNDMEDKLKPIHLTSTHKLTRKPDCIQNCPILLNEDQQFIESISFHTGCKQIKCLSNLKLKMKLLTQQNYDDPTSDKLIELKQLLIGFHQYAILNVRVSNQAEQAYSTMLELNLNPSIQIKKIESRCKGKYQFSDQTSSVLDTNLEHGLGGSLASSLDTNLETIKNTKNRTGEDSRLEIVCNLGNPLEKGSLDLQFVFDLFNTDLNTLLFTINASLHTTSSLTADSQVKQDLKVPLRRKASIALRDTQTTNMLFDFKSKNASNDKIIFSNYFQMIKTGFSNLPLLELTIYVPTNYTNLTLINGINIESLDGGSSSLQCDQIQFDTFDLIAASESIYRNMNKNNETNFLYSSHLNDSIVNENDDGSDISGQTNDEDEFYSKGQFNFSCQTMKCTKFKCSLRSIGFGTQIRLFKLTGSIDTIAIGSLVNQLAITNLSQIRLRTDFKLSVPDELIDLYQEDDDYLDYSSNLSVLHSAYVTIKQIPGQEKIAFWITIASILIGLFILFLLIIVLIKCGFFKRTKRDEMRRLKKKRETILLMPSAIPTPISKIGS